MKRTGAVGESARPPGAILGTLAAIVETIADGVIVGDAEGRITLVNGVAERLAGWSLGEGNGRLIDEVPIHAGAPGGSSTRALFDEALRDRCPKKLAAGAVLEPRGGTNVPVGGSISPIAGEGGEAIGAVIVLRDHSGQRALEVELSISKRMVALGTMTAGLAHELNNPLAFIAGNAALGAEQLESLTVALEQNDVAQATEAAGRLREVFRDLNMGADRVVRIVKELRTFAQPADAELAIIDLREVAESAVKLAWSELQHRARFVREFRPTPTIRGNAVRLSQVITNLLINAAQAIPQDGSSSDEHEIRLVLDTDAAGRAAVEVRDTGAGIPADLRARIFERFFTTKPVGFGMGLGLPICRSIVTSHGGEITVSGAGQRGSVFRVTLPAAGVEGERT
jgi:PAS domain S-box-containing protein